jgi:hypothetical protein
MCSGPCVMGREPDTRCRRSLAYGCLALHESEFRSGAPLPPSIDANNAHAIDPIL